MTLYYSLVFFILIAEMVIFLTLIIPLPHKMRRAFFTFISESPLIAKLQYGMKITFIFILILFIDSLNRVYRVQAEYSAFAKSEGSISRSVLGSERSEVQARKFYSQRNMYLCGFTLFLSLILNRTYVLILEILHLEDQLAASRTKPRPQSDDSSEVSELKKQLESKEKNMVAMKRQMESLTREYNRLGDETSKPESTPKKDR